MASRPLVTVQLAVKDEKSPTAAIPLPHVLLSPIRLDIVTYVHTMMSKNHRQPYAVAENAGMQHSAESWGTGRAVSRIPRVSGGGTHRAGQAAFGNMCRKGRMFAPTKIWRRWHRKISKGQRRYATCSAIAATGVPALVMSRGHSIELINEVPLVVADAAINSIAKTKEAIKLLKDLHAYEDVEKVKASRKTRVGVGKSRNRRHVQKKGPLVIHTKNLSDHSLLVNAFRNIPGVELCNVHRLNLLTLAPGGHLGRFVIWTESAFKELNHVWGSPKTDSKEKVGYRPPRALLTNADIARIINSDEVQSVLHAKKKQHRFNPRKKNPLKNLGAMVKLDPHALIRKRRAILQSQNPQKKTRTKISRKRREQFYKTLHAPAIAPQRAVEEGAPTF